MLALAGFLLFQYSIQHGLITPAMRVMTGIGVALVCLTGAELLAARAYRYTPEAMMGAGIVILYASFWSAHALYGLIGLAPSFALMALTTVAGCVLSVRHASQVVAVLGLVGGFATPLLLHSEADHPVSLFGYVLLLDLGLVAIGKSKGWSLLGLLSLAGTVLIQGLWIVIRMGPEGFPLGLAILGTFALLFAALGQVAPGRDRATWFLSQSGAVVIPFVFALYFASRADLGPHLYPVAMLLALLSAAAGWLARAQKAATLGLGAAVGCTAVVGVWMSQHALHTALAWETAAIAGALSALFHVFVELDPSEEGEGPAAAALVGALGLFALMIMAAGSAREAPLGPWLAAWIFLAALLYRQAALTKRGFIQVAATLGIGLGLAVHHAAWSSAGSAPFAGWPSVLVAAIVLSIAALAIARIRRLLPNDDGMAYHAAGCLPAVVLLSMTVAHGSGSIPPGLFLGSSLILGILLGLAAMGAGSGAWYAAGMTLTAMVHLVWTAARFGGMTVIFPWLEGSSFWSSESALNTIITIRGPGGASPGTQDALIAFVVALTAAALFAVGPFFAAGRLARSRWAWYAAALAAPAWFLPLRRLFELALGSRYIGILPIALGGLALGAALRTRTLGGRDDAARRSALVWFSAVAVSFAALAVPLQLSKEWITIGWALEGVAILALWKKLDHPGLKYYGLALLLGASARLVLNPAVLGYYPRSSVPVINWLAYTYLVPAAAMLAAGALLRPREVVRARSWEGDLYKPGRPLGSALAIFCGIFVVFAWINLTIVDWFATGTVLTLHLAHVPACDLTLSIAWALYALALLGFGMAGGSSALRWLSLSFLVLTIGKVFLYDLGELRDLYRVASLVGLAISLLLVSLLYQRFVFRKKAQAHPVHTEPRDPRGDQDGHDQR